MKLLHLLSHYRWPIYLGGLLAMPIVASGVLVWVATRPDSPRPITGYYEAARAWDATGAVEAASKELGWVVRYDLPSDIPHYPGMPRPVDVRVADRAGQPVTGLAGRVFALRPSDARLNQEGVLTELPQQPGLYRALLRLDEPGVWDLRIDVTFAADALLPGAARAAREAETMRGGRQADAPGAARRAGQAETAFRFVHGARFPVPGGAAPPAEKAR